MKQGQLYLLIIGIIIILIFTYNYYIKTYLIDNFMIEPNTVGTYDDHINAPGTFADSGGSIRDMMM